MGACHYGIARHGNGFHLYACTAHDIYGSEGLYLLKPCCKKYVNHIKFYSLLVDNA